MDHTHLLQALAFISTELHKSYKSLFADADADAKAKAGELIRKRMDYIAGTLQGDYLLGSQISVADCYLFVMLRWAKKFDLEPPAALAAFRDRMMKVPAVETAMKHEGRA